jgi:hypothetical protein
MTMQKIRRDIHARELIAAMFAHRERQREAGWK